MRRLWAWLVVGGTLVFTVDRPPASAPRHAAEWLDAGGFTLRTVRAGAGDTTLLLLHGYGESLMSYRTVFDRLARHYRVVAPDLPGFGLSDKPDKPYDFPSMQRRLQDFLERWTQGPVVVVGHSMGGQLAAGLALAEPERVVAVVLLAPAGYGLSPLVDTLTDSSSNFVGWVNLALGYVLPLHDPSWLQEPAERASYNPLSDPAYRTAATRVLREFDFRALRGRFGEIRQPVLLIWGTKDPTIPYEVGERIADLIPCNRFVTLPSTLHRPHQSLPDEVAAEIEQFLRAPRCQH